MFLLWEETFLKLQNGSWIKILGEGWYSKNIELKFFKLNFNLKFSSWDWKHLETSELENKEL